MFSLLFTIQSIILSDEVSRKKGLIMFTQEKSLLFEIENFFEHMKIRELFRVRDSLVEIEAILTDEIAGEYKIYALLDKVNQQIAMR